MTQPKNFVPEWAKRAVWYQIFPERFRNGDPGNDPTVDGLRGSYPHDHTSPWQVHAWTSDWYKLQPYEAENGHSIWFNLQRRRYGGDLQGILDKLGYLQDLGVNAIYLNPVFESPSSHKYDGATYHHIDPNFGPDPAGDRKIIARETGYDPSTWQWTSADRLMLQLIQEVHRRGMHIILDGVFNHVGLNHWAFKDVKEKQQSSMYKDWFKILAWDDPDEGTVFKYAGWWSLKELPELRQDRDGIVAGPRDYIFASTRRWMDPDRDGDPGDGIDGWRLDVAACVQQHFWKDWRKLVRSLNPQAYLTGEVVDTIVNTQPYLRGDQFDAVMNYNFTYACTEYFANERKKIPASAFDRRLQELREAFPAEVAYVMQNLLGSHDTDRIASRIVNRDKKAMRDWMKYYEWSKAVTPEYETRKPTAGEFHTQKLMAIFQMTYVGAPMIYYGEEAGMWGANDPCCRKPMLWEEFVYQDEATLPHAAKAPAGAAVKFDRDMFEHYRRLIHIRRAHPALQVGDYQTLFVDDKQDWLAFSRSYEQQQIIVIINSSAEEQLVRFHLKHEGKFVYLLDPQFHIEIQAGQFKVPLPPRWGRILLRE
jgi:glycosidase